MLKQLYSDLSKNKAPITAQEMQKTRAVAAALDAQAGNTSFSQSLEANPYNFRDVFMHPSRLPKGF